MARRTTHHATHAQKLVPKGQPESRVLRKKLPIGKPYSLEEIQKLIARLTSRDMSVRIAAVAQFAKDQDAVTEAAAKLPEVSATGITEKVIEAILKNEKEMLERFEKERKVEALRFLAGSSAVPERVKEKAEIILQHMPEEKTEKPAAVKEKAEAPELHGPTEMYTPLKVKILVKSLESKAERIKVAAAVQFIKDYARITPVVAKMPLLTVTEVTTKAVKAIKEHSEPIIETMVRKRMVEALGFLASLKQVPLHIRNKAFQAAERLKAAAPLIPAKAAVPEPAGKEGRPPGPKELPRSKEYAPLQLEALLNGLESVHRARAVKAAVEFLRNYEVIADAVTKAPMLTVTEVTKKAVGVVEGNLGAVLKELKKQRDVPALNLLANSSKFSSETRRKAASVLKTLLGAVEEE